MTALIQVPPLFLDVRPDHFALDSKLFFMGSKLHLHVIFFLGYAIFHIFQILGMLLLLQYFTYFILNALCIVTVPIIMQCAQLPVRKHFSCLR